MHSNNDVIMEQDNTQYQSESPESQKQNKDDNTPRKERMEIEINKYKQLVDAISNPRILAKAIVVIAVIVVFIFLGISLVSLMLKKFFPYKAISTMQSGATIIQNEDTEVIYWLFNSADLWSNSGIKVEEGDIITVRASGAFHTAIHHAVEDANSNTTFRDDWILPTGGRRPLNSHDSSRMEYRIMPHANDNVLLMQIIPEKKQNDGRAWIEDTNRTLTRFRDGDTNYIDNNCYYADIVIIGEEKRDIKIPHDGILHFAVNDIVLTRRKIKEMQKGHVQIGYNTKTGKYGDIGKLKLGPFPIPHEKKELDTLINYMNNNSKAIEHQRYKNGRSYEEDISRLKNIKDIKTSLPDLEDIISRNLTELDYYFINNFVDAWFVDNVGSILIAIERKKK